MLSATGRSGEGRSRTCCGRHSYFEQSSHNQWSSADTVTPYSFRHGADRSFALLGSARRGHDARTRLTSRDGAETNRAEGREVGPPPRGRNEVLGGHLTTGQLWTGQNRPVG